MKVKEFIKKNGEGEYEITYKTIHLFYSGMAGRDVTETYTVTYKNGNYITSVPDLFSWETEATWESHQYSIEIKCLERYFDVENYNSKSTQTKEFELIIGVTEGYNHNNENSDFDICKLYQQIATQVQKETRVYISAVISKSTVVYPNCNGETVYSIKGTCNLAFVESFEKYRQVTEEVAKILASELKQTTFTLTWKDVELNYFKK